jgi:mRNA-degrading endonuclease toxin of MazEF toxin-antitoxin module
MRIPVGEQSNTALTVVKVRCAKKKKKHSGQVLDPGRWTFSVNCAILVEQISITLTEHINKEITGGVSVIIYRTLH